VSLSYYLKQMISSSVNCGHVACQLVCWNWTNCTGGYGPEVRLEYWKRKFVLWTGLYCTT